jgi:hypothetical protein
MTEREILHINDVPVRYDGEGLERYWFTILTPGRQTTMCLKNCTRITISRYSKMKITFTPEPVIAEQLQELARITQRPIDDLINDILEPALDQMIEQQVPIPPQGYWSTPPDRREKFLERANRSHHGAGGAVAQH